MRTEDKKPESMSTTSYYPCPFCQGQLSLTEHYYPRENAIAPFSLEFVILECNKRHVISKGIDEVEAYTCPQQSRK